MIEKEGFGLECVPKGTFPPSPKNAAIFIKLKPS